MRVREEAYDRAVSELALSNLEEGPPAVVYEVAAGHAEARELEEQQLHHRVLLGEEGAPETGSVDKFGT